ncbi:ABC transport system, periplasmic solute-binding protein precursor [Streptomyces zinciresistens K42]|uniref:ABC transport system, periplasmic solute-binding protein n=1 Tax=Streptomyces zinciresistens K42 TaxID=700597 RepID=G2GGN2_9ACTN|nr:transporter substrate-binding domain-containing protein [Streptomyces zinciresistens]EGX57327.1 ABC transport system, periplasmic solute-binding protein precursor [Streptomyces zinciresistens K42]
MHATTRRTLLAASAAVLLLPLTACGGGDGGSAGAADDKYKLVQNGVITAGTQAEQPPFAVTDASGNPSGFAVDLMNEAAKRLDVKVQYKTTNLQGILAGLSAGQYDIGVAGVGATPERARQVSFTVPYYWGFTAVLTEKGAAQRELADFDGKRVGVVSGSVQEAFVTQRMPKSRLVKFKDQTALISQLLSGGINGMVVGGADADEYVEKQPVRIAVERDSLQGSAFPLRKNGDPALLRDLDAQLDAMIKDGTYVRLYKKYFKDPIAVDLLKERPELASRIKGTDLAPTEG